MFDLGMSALKEATRLAQDYIGKAEKLALEDVERCQNYLRAAQVAIIGLETEYDQIIVQAEICELDQPEQVRQLRERIREYLMVDKLRPELQKAVAGLDECRKALQKDANRFLQWPWTKKNRQVAVTEFADLLQQLVQYLKELDSRDLEYRQAGTGVAQASLHAIMGWLSYGAPTDQSRSKGFSQLINSIQQDRTKDRLLDSTERIERIINRLLLAFR